MYFDINVDLDEFKILEQMDNDYIKEYLYNEGEYDYPVIDIEIVTNDAGILDEIFKRVQYQNEDANEVIGDIMRRNGIYHWNV